MLQAIALAAAGPTLANSLARSTLASFFDRRPASPRKVKIAAEFSLPPLSAVGKRPHPTRQLPVAGRRRPTRVSSELTLGPGQLVIRGRSWYGDLDSKPAGPTDDPLEHVRASNCPWWFVAGYGVDRRLTLESGKVARPAEERLRSLFEPTPPTGLGFSDQQSYGKVFASAFNKLLRKVLVAQAHTVPQITDLELRGAGGVSLRDLAEKDKFQFEIAGKPYKMPATYLSHGYQSTLSWIADLVGQFLLDFEGVGVTDPRNLSGLVLVDELDLFLHPDWQADFIDALSQTFPNLQFVATTHSPLLISRLRPEQVVLLDWDEEGDIIAQQFEDDPRLMTATDLYRRLFGIENPPPTDLARVLSRYKFLAADPERDNREDKELGELRSQLDTAGIHAPAPTRRSRKPRS
ncbi:AAA family ATPase [Enhygromyxa salina]|nr:AAA family ATPase [Enhygromyxa salina]